MHRIAWRVHAEKFQTLVRYFNTHPKIRQFVQTHGFPVGVPSAEFPVGRSSVERSKEEWLQIAYDCLQSVRVYLLCGTCLGAVRDNALIEYDPDADLGVMMDQFANVLAAIPNFIRHGFYILHTKKWTLTLGIPGQRFHIDIMVIKPVKNPCVRWLGFQWFFDQRFYKEDYIANAEPYTFLDRLVYVPSPVRAYLEQLYGSDWETPQQHRPSGVLPLFTQIILRPFVRFKLDPSFSGANWCLEWRPWASRLLNRYGTQWALYNRYTHPS